MKDMHTIAWLLLTAAILIPSATYAQSSSGTTSPAPVFGSNSGNTGKRTLEKGHHVKKKPAKPDHPDHKGFAKKSRHKMTGGAKDGATSGGTTSPAGGH